MVLLALGSAAECARQQKYLGYKRTTNNEKNLYVKKRTKISTTSSSNLLYSIFTRAKSYKTKMYLFALQSIQNIKS